MNDCTLTQPGGSAIKGTARWCGGPRRNGLGTRTRPEKGPTTIAAVPPLPFPRAKPHNFLTPSSLMGGFYWARLWEFIVVTPYKRRRPCTRFVLPHPDPNTQASNTANHALHSCPLRSAGGPLRYPLHSITITSGTPTPLMLVQSSSRGPGQRLHHDQVRLPA